MQDKELYQHILGLTSPWTVSEVKLDIPAEEIQVRVEHPAGTKFCCPECHKELACYDHAEERRWRQLDSRQYKTILIGRVPRVDCPEHGVKTVTVPWALPHSRFTIMFERLRTTAKNNTLGFSPFAIYRSLPGERGPTKSSYAISGPRRRRVRQRATSEIGISESFVPRWRR